jgi:hypothetical protein
MNFTSPPRQRSKQVIKNSMSCICGHLMGHKPQISTTTSWCNRRRTPQTAGASMECDPGWHISRRSDSNRSGEGQEARRHSARCSSHADHKSTCTTLALTANRMKLMMCLSFESFLLHGVKLTCSYRGKYIRQGYEQGSEKNIST